MPRRPAVPLHRFDAPSALMLAAFATAYASVTFIRGLPLWTHLLYAGASLLCFALYAVDKGAARAGRDRISESTLLSLGLVGGWPGVIVAQQALRHKTVKRAFRIRFWLSVAANVAVFAWAATR
jgi:uncharacterized membrane protein YsdA (DUF1294 family)